MSARWFGWHLSYGVLGHGDWRPIRAGDIHTVDGPLEMCKRGLHASKRPLDALIYGAGSVIAYVELLGPRLDHTDKSAALQRRYVRVAEAGPVLHEFACRCAEVALMVADVEDELCWNPIHVKREWIAGRATDSELSAACVAACDAARTAARDAACDAAWDAVRTAACDAAWDAARTAAWVAACDAACDAARAAARVAACDAAWDAACDAARAAACDAARVAARVAARDEANELLEEMLLEALGLPAREER